MKEVFIINFKTYKQGEKALELAKIAQRINKDIIVGVQATDINEISSKTKLRVYAQHVDYFDMGRNTGFIMPESVKANGAEGTFLNHSEHKLKFNILKKTMERCRKAKLKTAVFVTGLKEAKKVAKLKPDFLIFEPPELVAGKISVSSAKPELIEKISRKIKMKFLVGAGIHEKKDVEVAMKLGASGIAVASSITNSNNPAKSIRELIV